jgi:hypothetical protein
MTSRTIRMAAIEHDSVGREMELIGRVSDYYHRRFLELIEQMNRQPGASDSPTMRLCVEAVDAVLATHSQIARLLSEIAEPTVRPPQNRAA